MLRQTSLDPKYPSLDGRCRIIEQAAGPSLRASLEEVKVTLSSPLGLMSSGGGVGSPPASRSFARDLLKAYAAILLGLLAGLLAVGAAQRWNDPLYFYGAVAAGPLFLLILLLGYRASSRGLSAARVGGSFLGYIVAGWLYLHPEWLYMPIAALGVLASFLVLTASALMIATGMLAGDFVRMFARRL